VQLIGSSRLQLRLLLRALAAVPFDCVAADLALTASSVALAVTSRAFEVFHTE
jgi:hypothetical protein